MPIKKKKKDKRLKRATFFVLDLCLDIVNGVTALNLEGNGLASQCFYEYLHLLLRRKSQNRVEQCKENKLFMMGLQCQSPLTSGHR